MTSYQPGQQISPPTQSTIAPKIQGPKVTEDLPAISWKLPESIEEMLSSSSSTLGLSGIMNFLGCPRQAQLKASGVRRKSSEVVIGGPVEIEDALSFGLVAHALRATRLFYGMDVTLALLGRINIDEKSRMKLNNLLRLYDFTYPLGTDPWQYLGIEVEVISDIGDGQGGSCIRSVRYDTVIRYPDTGEVFSFECKTAARSGRGTINQYMAQRSSHAAIWNANPNLVSKYGRMVGTIYDLWLKTEVPEVPRVGPEYASKIHQRLATDYLRLPEQITLPQSGSGLPQFLHSCWGKYRPCDYINLCWEDAHGDYEFRGQIS